MFKVFYGQNQQYTLKISTAVSKTVAFIVIWNYNE